MSSQAQIRAQKKYAAMNEKKISFSLNRNTDADIINFLNQQPNKLKLFKSLIRSYMWEQEMSAEP